MWRELMILLVTSPVFCQRLWVGNAAASTSPATYFAPGTMISVVSGLLTNGSPSTRLELRVRVGSGAVVPLHILEVQNNRMWAVVPEGAPLGPATISLSAQAGTEESDVVVVPSAVGIFAKYREGAGAAYIGAETGMMSCGTVTTAVTIRRRPAIPGDTSEADPESASRGQPGQPLPIRVPAKDEVHRPSSSADRCQVCGGN